MKYLTAKVVGVEFGGENFQTHAVVFSKALIMTYKFCLMNRMIQVQQLLAAIYNSI